jgi:murein L,D-transpeptidase YcbB/YkuD
MTALSARACRCVLLVVSAAVSGIWADLGSQSVSSTSRDSAVATGLRRVIESGRNASQRWPVLHDVSRDLRTAYGANGWLPLWTTDGVPTEAARIVVQQLAQIDARGLSPADYDVAPLATLVAQPALVTPDAVIRFDMMLSVAATRALSGLQFGRVPASAVHAQLRFVHEPYDVAEALRALAASTDPAVLFDAAEPPFLHYQLLKAALARFRAVTPDTTTLAGLTRGTKRARDDRVAQIALTMERWRWLPHTISTPPPIIVNIPAFRLHAFTSNSDREADLISMDVVVGQAFDHKTPVFSTLRYLIFSPYWDVPPSIARKELLPLARRDPSYLRRGEYEAVSNSGAVIGTSSSAINAVAAGHARLRQRPGSKNALGGVKFIFPNSYNVYLHDTPSQSVFLRARRDASHGCVRIAQPLRLASFLLRDQPGWDSTRVAEASHRSAPLQVNLTQPVPVHIVYATAVARENGEVNFYADLYGHDRTLARLLARGYPYRGASH